MLRYALHLIYLHQHFSTPKGSTGNRSYAFARALVEKGHQVTVLCGSYGGGVTGLGSGFDHGGVRVGVVEGIQVVEFQLSYSNRLGLFTRAKLFLQYSLKSIKYLRMQRFDLLYATSTPLTVAIPALFAKFVLGKRYIFEVRDLWPELPVAMGVIGNPFLIFLLRMLEKLAYRFASVVVGLSPGMINGIEGVGARRSLMIPNGCDEPPAIRTDIRSLFHLNSDDFVAVFAGTHGVANGLDQLVLLADEIQSRGITDIKILLVGDGKLKEGLKRSAAGLDTIIFADPIPRLELLSALGTASVGLQILANVPAFQYGTSPNKFFDYLSVSLPVICNYPGWVSDIISEHECGVTVPTRDIEAFADILVSLRDDPTKVATFRQNCAPVAEMFSRLSQSAAFVALIEEEANLA